MGCWLRICASVASQCCAGSRTGTLMLPTEARVWCQVSHPPQGSRAWRFCPVGSWACV